MNKYCHAKEKLLLLPHRVSAHTSITCYINCWIYSQSFSKTFLSGIGAVLNML